MCASGHQSDLFSQLDDITQLLDVLETIPGSLFMIKDLDSRYVYMSKMLKQEIRGNQDWQIIGKTDFDLFPKIIAESFRQNDLLVLNQGRTLLNELHASVNYAGKAKWYFSSKYPLSDRKQKIIGLITINQAYDEVIGLDSELNQLLPAIQKMTNHFDQKLSVSELANHCGLSSSHFMRLFKQQMHITVHTFLEKVRMFYAIDALKHQSDSISSIAQQCGFYDHSSFVKRFKKHTGATPLQFRKQYQSSAFSEKPYFMPSVLPDSHSGS